MTLYAPTNPKARPIFAAAMLALIVAGCASNSALVSNHMDPVTSVTVSYSQTPMVFYRDVSGRAAYARDFVHMAPLEVNRSGDYRYYLWLGIWTTLAGAQPKESRDGFESIVVFADGEPLPLEIAGWSVSAIGASESVYLKPVASATDAYYKVTQDQLRLIAEATDIRLQTGGSRRKSYEPWDDQKSARASLSEFLKAPIF